MFANSSCKLIASITMASMMTVSEDSALTYKKSESHGDVGEITLLP